MCLLPEGSSEATWTRVGGIVWLKRSVPFELRSTRMPVISGVGEMEWNGRNKERRFWKPVRILLFQLGSADWARLADNKEKQQQQQKDPITLCSREYNNSRDLRRKRETPQWIWWGCCKKATALHEHQKRRSSLCVFQRRFGVGSGENWVTVEFKIISIPRWSPRSRR